MINPKYGDKRVVDTCVRCGGDIYEVYESWPVYHNDSMEGWRRYPHLSDTSLCIRSLADRLARLEGK